MVFKITPSHWRKSTRSISQSDERKTNLNTPRFHFWSTSIFLILILKINFYGFFIFVIYLSTNLYQVWKRNFTWRKFQNYFWQIIMVFFCRAITVTWSKWLCRLNRHEVRELNEYCVMQNSDLANSRFRNPRIGSRSRRIFHGKSTPSGEKAYDRYLKIKIIVLRSFEESSKAVWSQFQNLKNVKGSCE